MDHIFYIDNKEDGNIEIYTFENDQKYIINKNTNNDEMKVAIVGSRSISDQMFVETLFNCFVYIFGKPTKIISGGARGIDSFAGEFAGINKIELQVFRPDWSKYGKKAGFVRNEYIIKNCDICLAIWDGYSGGTKHDLELCEQYKKDLVLFNYKEYSEGNLCSFHYKQYDKELEIKFEDACASQAQSSKPLYKKYNRWLPQPGIISA